MKLSNCCGAEIYNEDSDLCPACGEHCGFEEADDEQALDAQDLANMPKEGDFSGVFNREQLL